MMSILAFAWAAFKICFWVAFFLTLIGGTFLLFHPVHFDVKVRASLYGQRAHIWVSYFFGLFGLGTVASPGSQNVLIRFWKWQWKLIKPEERKKTPPRAPSPPSSPAAGQTSSPPFVSPVEAPPSPAVSSEPPAPLRSRDRARETPVPQRPPTVEPPLVTPPKEEPAADEEKPSKGVAESAPARVEEASIKSEPVSPFSAKPPKTLPISFEGETISGSESSGADSGIDTFWKKLQNIRKKMAKTLKKIKWFYVKGRVIWNRFSPMMKDLFWDLWNTFRIRGPQVNFRYGFDEPHLVGMTQGVVAQIAGLVWPWGVRLNFDPVFNGNTVLLNGTLGLTIFPWKIVYSGTRLLFQRDLWRGANELYQWYKTRKTKKDNTPLKTK